jgi:hypothetical protein
MQTHRVIKSFVLGCRRGEPKYGVGSGGAGGKTRTLGGKVGASEVGFGCIDEDAAAGGYGAVWFLC